MSKHEIHNNKMDGKKIIDQSVSSTGIFSHFNRINSALIEGMKTNLAHLIPTVVIGKKESSYGTTLDNRDIYLISELADSLYKKLETVSDCRFEIFESLKSLERFKRLIPKIIQDLKQECFTDIYNLLGSESLNAYKDLPEWKKKIYNLYEFYEDIQIDLDSEQRAAENNFIEYVYERYPDEACYFGCRKAILEQYDYFGRLDDYYDPDNYDAVVPRKPNNSVRTNSYLYD